jgi:hypothetical protein
LGLDEDDWETFVDIGNTANAIYWLIKWHTEIMPELIGLYLFFGGDPKAVEIYEDFWGDVKTPPHWDQRRNERDVMKYIERMRDNYDVDVGGDYDFVIDEVIAKKKPGGISWSIQNPLHESHDEIIEVTVARTGSQNEIKDVQVVVVDEWPDGSQRFVGFQTVRLGGPTPGGDSETREFPYPQSLLLYGDHSVSAVVDPYNDHDDESDEGNNLGGPADFFADCFGWNMDYYTLIHNHIFLGHSKWFIQGAWFGGSPRDVFPVLGGLSGVNEFWSSADHYEDHDTNDPATAYAAAKANANPGVIGMVTPWVTVVGWSIYSAEVETWATVGTGPYEVASSTKSQSPGTAQLTFALSWAGKGLTIGGDAKAKTFWYMKLTEKPHSGYNPPMEELTFNGWVDHIATYRIPEFKKSPTTTLTCTPIYDGQNYEIGIKIWVQAKASGKFGDDQSAWIDFATGDDINSYNGKFSYDVILVDLT